MASDNFNDNSIGPQWTFTDQDTVAGTAHSEAGGQLLITAGGVDTWYDYDEYASLYYPIVGAFTITVKVVSQENVNDWTKTGIMVRNDMTGAGTSTGYIFMAVTPANNFTFQYDNTHDGFLDTSVQAGSTAFPCWLKIIKTVNGANWDFEGFYSINGSDYTSVKKWECSSANDTQDVGMAVISHADTTTSDNVFDDWSDDILVGATGIMTPRSNYWGDL